MFGTRSAHTPLRPRPASDTVDQLTQIAEVLGHEIVVAERDTDLFLQARRAARLTLAVNALRNARRAGLPLQDQAMLADQSIYAQHRGALHVATLLARIHLASGTVDAGSPRIRRVRQGPPSP